MNLFPKMASSKGGNPQNVYPNFIVYERNLIACFLGKNSLLRKEANGY
jgi:hypothetical protein